MEKRPSPEMVEGYLHFSTISGLDLLTRLVAHFTADTREMSNKPGHRLLKC